MSVLLKRLMMSVVMVSVSVGAIFFAPKWIFFLVLEAFILFALNEFFCFVEKKGLVIHKVLGLFFGALLPASIYFASEPIILLLACLCFFVFNFRQKFRDQALLSVSVTFFGVVYISWFFSFLNKIHYLPGGAVWTFYVLLLVKGGDAGAYFVGKRFGRVKLAEHISPNKSVEGALGGLLTTVLLSLLSAAYLPKVSFIHLTVMGIMVAILSQLGDLVESLIKRDVGVKDSGHVPGLGGILDVLDSLLLSVPFVYYYITSFANLV